MKTMNPINQAWAILKDERTSVCEECGKRITFDDIGGFTDYGPHCKECEAAKEAKQ